MEQIVYLLQWPLLFTAMLNHGYCPSGMSSGMMVPVSKIRRTNQSDNFRAITLGSIFSKKFELIIAYRFKDELASSHLQFGFKSNSSTTTCSFCVQEVLTQYNCNGSLVYCTFLDA